MDDGSGVMLPYMTEIQHRIRENAMMGLELTKQLVDFGRRFHGQLHAALPSDINAPEAIQLMNAWRELESKFLAFLDLVPFSDPFTAASDAGTSRRIRERIESATWVAHES